MRIGPKPAAPKRTRVYVQDTTDSQRARHVKNWTLYEDPKSVTRVVEQALREAFERTNEVRR